MSHNRIGAHLPAASEPTVTDPAGPQPLPPAASPIPAIPPGFAFCPVSQSASAGSPMSPASFIHQAAYQQALLEARDRAWRAFLERTLFSVWN